MNTIAKAAAAAVAVAILAVASYATASRPAGFLWVAANFIVLVLWLLSSSRHNKTTTSSSSNHVDISAAMHEFYPTLSEHDVFAAVVPPLHHALGSDGHVSKKQPRETKTAKKVDRPRVRKKPDAERPRTVVAVEAKPFGGNGWEEEEDVSLDSMWQTIMQRGAARPVAVRKSETWGNDELPRLERVAMAEKAVGRKEMRKSATVKEPPVAAGKGWRTRPRDVLVMAQDELLRRAESLIRRHHEHLRLQRQESEQRQALELQRGRRVHIRA